MFHNEPLEAHAIIKLRTTCDKIKFIWGRITQETLPQRVTCICPHWRHTVVEECKLYTVRRELMSRNKITQRYTCHNELDAVSNHRRLDYLLNRCSGADQRKHQSLVSLAFVRGIQQWPESPPHRGLVMRKMFPSDVVIMKWQHITCFRSELAKQIETTETGWSFPSFWHFKISGIWFLDADIHYRIDIQYTWYRPHLFCRSNTALERFIVE